MAYQKYDLQLKIANYYYKKGLTQQEISKRLEISRPTVSKLLKKARANGIVEINVIDINNRSNLIELEKNLEENFHLDEAVVAECNFRADLFDCIGKAAADYFNRIISDNFKIGISWGRTLKTMADKISGDKQVEGLEVVTLVGGSGDFNAELHSNIIAEKIINKYNGKGYFLYAPAIVDNEEVRSTLVQNKETQKILSKARDVDAAFVGVGSPIETSSLLQTGYFKKSDIVELKKNDAVGDICSRFFNKKGEACNISLNKRAIGISLKDIKQIDKVVGVAGGEDKISSIKAAIKGGLIDVLITDNYTAEVITKSTKSNSN